MMRYIQFIPTNGATKDVAPSTAKSHIPQWYKNGEAEIGPVGHKGPGMKKCIPFLDAMTSGYVLTTWTNIYVKVTDSGAISVTWDADASSEPVKEREMELGSTIPRPAGHAPNHLAWTPKWGIKTPRGYSVLVTHPLNRWDLPFTTTSGIIDSDKFYGSGNIPFFIKEGFEGVIPKGTPFVQLIPIKRKTWVNVFNTAIVKKSYRVSNLIHLEKSRYKKKLWVKKDYR